MKTGKLTTRKAVICFFFMIIFAGMNVLSAQSAGYNSGLGLRFGSDVGITGKTTVGKGYLEGILGSGYRAFMITGLYERYIPAFHRDDFHWYFGGGGHVGFFDRWYAYGYYDRWGYYHGPYLYQYGDPTIGIDGIFGLEYKFQQIPFAASFDLKPFINLYRYDYGFMEGALSFRYVW
ncbi:MAG TPA: hypothetical protein VFU15_08290 [Bacteroidia bacterium]|nr:hypothetical protein [Bacteroidia bacterium]